MANYFLFAEHVKSVPAKNQNQNCLTMAPQDAQLIVAQVENFQAAEAFKETQRKFFQGVLAQVEPSQRSQNPG